MSLTRITAPRALLVGAGLVHALAIAPAASAQVSASKRASNLAVNGAIGSVLAAAHAVVRGRNPLKALAPGFGGGVLMGAGKQVAASRFFGAGLIGRQVSMIGVGVVEVVARDTMVFRSALGPLTLEIRPRARDKVQPRINVVDAATLLVYVLRADAHLDVGGTISTGAPVFRLPIAKMEFDGGFAEGFQHTGVILMANELASDPRERQLILAHESVHLLQEDALSDLVGVPLERGLIAILPFGDRAPRLFEVGAIAPLSVIAVSMRLRYERRPWEREAYLLTEGNPDP
jgi:hypothetical protein